MVFNRFLKITGVQNQLPITFCLDLVCNKTLLVRNLTPKHTNFKQPLIFQINLFCKGEGWWVHCFPSWLHLPVWPASMRLPYLLIHSQDGTHSIEVKYQSPGFLNKCIGILENHSEFLSFSLHLQQKRGIEKKRETQNGFLECQYIYSKNQDSGFMIRQSLFVILLS